MCKCHPLFTNALFSARWVDEQEDGHNGKCPYLYVPELEKAEYLGHCAPGEHVKTYKAILLLGSHQ